MSIENQALIYQGVLSFYGSLYNLNSISDRGKYLVKVLSTLARPMTLNLLFFYFNKSHVIFEKNFKSTILCNVNIDINIAHESSTTQFLNKNCSVYLHLSGVQNLLRNWKALEASESSESISKDSDAPLFERLQPRKTAQTNLIFK